jgi:hypothetical protein
VIVLTDHDQALMRIGRAGGAEAGVEVEAGVETETEEAAVVAGVGVEVEAGVEIETEDEEAEALVMKEAGIS